MCLLFLHLPPMRLVMLENAEDLARISIPRWQANSLPRREGHVILFCPLSYGETCRVWMSPLYTMSTIQSQSAMAISLAVVGVVLPILGLSQSLAT